MGGLRNLIGGILLGLAFATLLAGGPAAAKETILTEDSVSRFLASFGEMRDIAIAEGLKTGADSEAAKNPLGAVLKAIKSSKLKADAEKIAKAHGFADLKDWGVTGKAVAQAYLFITVGPAQGIGQGRGGAEQGQRHQAIGEARAAERGQQAEAQGEPRQP